MHLVLQTILSTSTLIASDPLALLTEKLIVATAAMAPSIPVVDPREAAFVAALRGVGYDSRASLQGIADAITALTGATPLTLSDPAPVAFPFVPGGVVVPVRSAPNDYRTGIAHVLVKTGAGSIVGLRTVDNDGLPFAGDSVRQGTTLCLNLKTGNGDIRNRLATEPEIREVAARLFTAPMSRVNITHLLDIMGLDAAAILPPETTDGATA